MEPTDDLPPLPDAPAGRYRHYKGLEYDLVGVVRHSETLEPLVLYRPRYGSAGLWVRPHAMFFEDLVIDGRQLPRFARIEPAKDAEHPLSVWHRLVGTHDPSGLHALLAEDAVFHSPVVHTPQRGRALVAKYLAAAFQVFGGPDFRYVREIVGETEAMLEFETVVDGVTVDGIDLIRWNEAGRIADFKVMVRPLKAIQTIHQRMAAMLQASP